MTRLPIVPAICTLLAGPGVLLAAHARLAHPVEITAAQAITESPVQVAARAGSKSTGDGKGLVVHRSANGMFYMPARVNGKVTSFLVDTGASTVVLTRSEATALGVDLTQADDSRSVRVVGGQAPVSFVRLERLEFAGRTLENVEAAIVDQSVGAPLLGQSALAQLDSLVIKGDRMHLY